MLNSECAQLRDGADAMSASTQLEKIKKCMEKDCVQSLEGGNTGCAFLDPNGFCYAYATAQAWCR
jgi:hypothetical protein